MKKRLPKSHLIYSMGSIGRDMVFVLVAMFLMTYIQYTMHLTVTQFSAISVVVIGARIWDAVNDPMMGVVIENTRFKTGKFRPWILFGGCLNFIATIMLFTFRPEGWSFVFFFAVAYISWGMTYTINDIAYWSLLPNLASDNHSRNRLTNLVMTFASIGQFLSGGLIPVLVTGNAVMMYRISALGIAFIYLFFVFLTYFGVKDCDTQDITSKHPSVGIRDIFQILFKNDQLVIVTIGILLQTVAIELFIALAMNYFYFQFGYGGIHLTVFTLFFGLGTLSSLALFPILSKWYARLKLIRLSTFASTLGFLLFLNVGYLLPMNLPLLYTGVFLVFFGLGLFYVIIIILTANVIEYNELTTGSRNESIIFSVRPFMTKLGAAFQQGIVTLILITSGIYTYSGEIANLEQQKAQGLISDISQQASDILGGATPSMILSLKLGMGIIPMILMITAGLLVTRKYVITEERYDEILAQLNR